MGIFRVGLFLGGSCPGENFLGGEGGGGGGGEFSWLGVVRVRIFWVGVILGRNFLWWKFSGWELSRGNHPGGSFHVTLLNIVLCCKIYLMSMNLSKNYSFFLNILKTY